MTKLMCGNQARSRAIKGDRTWSTGVMPEPPAMKPIVSKSFVSPEGVCVNVVSESAFTLPFTALFGCKMSVLKMYLMWEGARDHQWSSAAISGHQWSSAAISGHQRPIWTRTGRTVH
jgi:hypothetical protein